MSTTLLVRYGTIPEVARFSASESLGPWERGQSVVVRTHRGVEMGSLLDVLRSQVTSHPNGNSSEESASPSVLRIATDEDQQRFEAAKQDVRDEFETWCQRIADWNLELELIDMEWLLDREQLILYVLNERGSDCTKLALYSAAKGLGTIVVQPVGMDGLVQMPTATTGGCGSGGGGCGSCGSE
jgi:cell fate regulator YaaT (PSP1 superfamily)